MDERGTLSSVLADAAIVADMVPFPCLSDFGPSGRFRLEEVVGAGASSIVYRATDRQLASEGFEPQVAIKLIRAQADASREAKALRRVEHPNVVRVLECGIARDDLSYVASDYIAGGDLSDLSMPVPPKDAAGLVSKLARAMQAVHSAGLVHCDLKPSNVLMSKAGEPMLTDFGLAHWSSDRSGAPRGNLAFMSPEQYYSLDTALTPPSDIYAIGGLLSYLLTGRNPHGSNAEEIKAFHESRAVPVLDGVPSDLEHIVRRAMDRERERRYHSAGELADDLDRWTSGEPIPWVRYSRFKSVWMWTRRHPIRALAYAALIAALCGSVGGYSYLISRDRKIEARHDREARALAEQRVEELKTRLRELIRSFMSQMNAVEGQAAATALLPSIVLMNWLTSWPEADAGTVLLATDGKIHALTLISRPNDSGPQTLDRVLADYALAYCYSEKGDTEGARTALGRCERELESKTTSNDPIRVTIATIKRACEALDSRNVSVRRKESIASLKTAVAAVPAGPAFEPARMLLARTVKTLERIDEGVASK